MGYYGYQERGVSMEDNDKGFDLVKINSIDRNTKIQIAEELGTRLDQEVGEYHVSKNESFRQIAREVGDKYGLNLTEAMALYLGWDLYKQGYRAK